MNPWPFSDPPNLAVIVNWEILRGEAWIAYVSHDEDDGGWQFHTNDPGPPKESDAAVVGLSEMLDRDATLADLADLPLGWRAWRETPTSPWHRKRKSS